MVDTRRRSRRYLRLGVEGNAQAGFGDHVHVIGAVTDRHRLVFGEPQLLA